MRDTRLRPGHLPWVRAPAHSLAARANKEILELVDLVEKEDKEKLSGTLDREIAKLLEEEGVSEGEDVEGLEKEASEAEDILDEGESLGEPEIDLDFSDISSSELAVEAEGQAEEKTIEEEMEIVEEKPAEALELDLSVEEEVEPKAGIEEEGIAEIDVEEMLEEEPAGEAALDLESLIEPEEPITDLPEEAELEGPAPEVEARIPPEEVSEAVAAQPEQPEPKEVPVELAGEALIGISEEKIEAIVTRVVQDVVDRVMRETVADVAERVISEAIDALKQSLESTSD